MHFRRSAATLVAAAALLSTACQTKLDDRGVAQSASFAVFDPATNSIPLPNDLALAATVAAGCATAATAQSQFLCSLAASGGFPNDQEVPLTFGFQRQSVVATGAVIVDPLALDTTTVKVLGAVPPAAATVAVFDVTNAPSVAPVVVEASYAAATSTLKLRKLAAADGSRRWIAGHKYVAFVRGGAAGVKAAGGAEIEPMPTMFVLREAIISNRDLTDPANQTLIPGTAEAKAVAGAKLEPIRRGYLPLKAIYEGTFGAGSFGDLLNVLTFTVAPSPAVVVEVDAVKGSAPLPIDLLRAPDAAGGLILDNPAYGSARTGIVTLDGFSTTASITAPLTGGATVTAGAIDASTVTGDNVFLFEVGSATTQLRELKRELATMGTGGNPAAAAYVAQPTGTYVPGSTARCPIAGGCATSIVLQPAVAVSDAGPFLPPLKGGTKYAVVVTNRVKDLTGRGLGRSTAARILLDVAAPVDASIGVDPGTAALLQQMRTDLAPIWSALPSGTTKADVAMAYVFKTQSVTDGTLQLSALPYRVERVLGAAVFSPAGIASVTASYPAVTGASAIYEVTLPTVDVTSRVTGALDPAVLGSTTLLAAHVAPLKAIVAVPDAASVPPCPGGSGARCAPLVVFAHGLTRSKSSLLVSGGQPPASALLAQGFVVAAIDFPQHGDRAWCLRDSDCTTGTCARFTTPTGAPAYQGDTDAGVPVAPGTCSNHDPKPSASGQTFVSANFFRTRDMFRQNALDQSALVLALARPPSSPQPAANPFTAALVTDGIPVVVNPGAVYWEGISLGGIAGTEVLATNPRFSRGVTSVAGGTLVDVFTGSYTFAANVTALFSSLLKPQLDAIGAGGFDKAFIDPSNATSFTPAVAAAYGKTLLVAKWILDPGDPLNYARALRTAPLPNLLTGAAAQPAKSVLGQVAIGDLVIPNTSNRELFAVGAVDQVEYTSLSYAAADMHGLLGFDPIVQADAAHYLFDLTKPPAPPTRITVGP